MSSFTVQPEDLQALDAFLAAAAARARAAVGRVRAEAEALFTTGWQGGAASAFRLGWQEWSDGATAVLAALDRMAELAGSSGAGYAGTDASVREAIARSAS